MSYNNNIIKEGKKEAHLLNTYVSLEHKSSHK